MITICSAQARSLTSDNLVTSTPNTTETSATSQQSTSTTSRSSDDASELRPVFVRNSDVSLFDRGDFKSARQANSGEKIGESEIRSYNFTFSPQGGKENSTASSVLTMTPRSTIVESLPEPSNSARTFIDILRDYEKHKLKSSATSYVGRSQHQKGHFSALPGVNYDNRMRVHSLTTSSNEATILEPQSLQGYSQDLIPSPESFIVNHLDDEDPLSTWVDDEHSLAMPGLKPFSGPLMDTTEASSSIFDLHALTAHHNHPVLDLFPHDFFLPEIIEAPPDHDAKNPTPSQSTAYETNYRPMSDSENEGEGTRHNDRDRDQGPRDNDRDQEYGRDSHRSRQHDRERDQGREREREREREQERERERERNYGEERNRENHENNPSLEPSHAEASTEHPGIMGHEDPGMDEPSFLNYAQLIRPHQMHSEELPILIESFVVNYPPLSKHPVPHGLSALSYEQQFPAINEGYRHQAERVLISPLMYSRPCKYDCFAPPLQDMKYGLMNFLKGAHNHG